MSIIIFYETQRSIVHTVTSTIMVRLVSCTKTSPKTEQYQKTFESSINCRKSSIFYTHLVLLNILSFICESINIKNMAQSGLNFLNSFDIFGDYDSTIFTQTFESLDIYGKDKSLLHNEKYFPTFKNLPIDTELDERYYRPRIKERQYGPGITTTYVPHHHWCIVAEIIENTSLARPCCSAKDITGHKFPIWFYLDNKAAAAKIVQQLQPKSIICWRYATSHHFMDFSHGLRIEDHHLPTVLIIPKLQLPLLFDVSDKGAFADYYLTKNPNIKGKFDVRDKKKIQNDSDKLANNHEIAGNLNKHCWWNACDASGSKKSKQQKQKLNRNDATIDLNSESKSKGGDMKSKDTKTDVGTVEKENGNQESHVKNSHVVDDANSLNIVANSIKFLIGNHHIKVFAKRWLIFYVCLIVNWIVFMILLIFDELF